MVRHLTKTTEVGSKTPHFFIQVFVFLSAYIAIVFMNIPQRNVPRSIAMGVSADIVKHTVLGYNTSTADLLWIRLIQNIDYKESNNVHFGWAYHMIDAITTLDPKFRMVYATALTALSVIVGDVEGASRLYERAVEQFPTDWPILYRAGYHYLYEAKNCDLAAKYFKQAGMNGGPPWVLSLSSRLYSRGGQLDIAEATMQDGLKKFEGKPQEEWFRKRIQELQEARKSGDTKLPVDCAPPAGQ